MSTIENYVSDYPQRCGDLLTEFWGKSNHIGREVTLLLAIAGSGIVVPYERLSLKHPFKDSHRYTEVFDSFNILLEENFNNSVLWKGNSNSWRYGKVKYHATQTFTDSLYGKSQPISVEKVSDILSVIRHSLAHGNILTEGDPIKTIFLLNVFKGTCRYLIVSPDDLHTFLNNWFTFISKLEIPSELIEGGEKAA